MKPPIMNNEDPISRAELLEAMKSAIDDAPLYIQATVDQMITEAPPSPPKVAHGRWDIFGCCNQCGYGDEKQSTQYIKENYKYCPYCGAKMGGEEDADR